MPGEAAAQGRLHEAEKASYERKLSHLQHELDSASASQERLHEAALHAESEMRSLRASVDDEAVTFTSDDLSKGLKAADAAWEEKAAEPAAAPVAFSAAIDPADGSVAEAAPSATTCPCSTTP